MPPPPPTAADFTDEQILKNLLALNLARAAEEAKAGTSGKQRAQREKDSTDLL